jgi:hypothetical protein
LAPASGNVHDPRGRMRVQQALGDLMSRIGWDAVIYDEDIYTFYFR